MTDEIAKIESKEMEVPSHIKNFQGQGEEFFSISELSPPKIKVAQYMSDDVKQKIIDAGIAYDPITKEIIGTEIDVIFCGKEANWVKFENDGKKFVSQDGIYWDDGSQLTEEEKWKKVSYRFYVLLRGKKMTELPHLLYLYGMSVRTAKEISELLGRLTKINKEPIFARAFKLKVVEMENSAKQSFFIWKLNKSLGWSTKEECDIAVNVIKNIKKSVYNVSDENLGPEMAEMDQSKFRGDEELE